MVRTAPFGCLSAQTEALDQRAVTLDVDALEVAQEAATLSDQQQQAAAAVVVVLVLPRVLREVEDALRQHRDLDLGGAGVALVRGVLGHDLLLDVGAQRHRSTHSFIGCCAVRQGMSTWALLSPRPVYGRDNATSAPPRALIAGGEILSELESE